MPSIRQISEQCRKQRDLEPAIKSALKSAHQLNQPIFALRTIEDSEALKRVGDLNKISPGARAGLSLFGLKFSAKDHIDIEGYSRSEGSLSTVERSTRTANCIKHLLSAGAVCLGKGNMAQYGKSYFTRNRDFGVSKNPYNNDYSPGGSSGGDAAAVAAGMVDFAIAADSGGSVRVPANFCGLYGLLPTIGLIGDGEISSETHTTRRLFRSLGPLAKSLEDLELIFRVIRQYDSADPRSIALPATCHMPGVEKKKIAYLSQLNGIKCDSAIKQDLSSVVKRYQDLGYECKEVKVSELEQCYEIFIILAGQAALIVEDLVDQLHLKPRDLTLESEDLQKLRKRVAEELPALTVENLLLCWYRVDALRNSIHKFFEQFDFILMPVAATSVVKNSSTEYLINGEKRESQQVFQFASCINVLGLPSIAFPTSINREGLPLGIQIVGPRFSDLELFRWLKLAGLNAELKP